jgi:hypothetical protein
MGTVRLISELYKQDVVPESVILVCIRELLDAANPKSMPPEVRGGGGAHGRAGACCFLFCSPRLHAAAFL